MDATAFSRSARPIALSLAFGIVAGGAALIGAPAYAVETATPVETTPAETAPVESTPVESTPAAEEATLLATTATDPSATPSTTPEAPAALAAAPTGATSQLTYTIEQFLAGVAFDVQGFTPGAQLEVRIGVANSETVPVVFDTAPVADATGAYSGVAVPPASWAELNPARIVGDYTIVVSEVGQPSVVASLDFTVVTDPANRTQSGVIDSGEKGRVSQNEAENSGVRYTVTGFLPGAQLVVSGTEADGSAMPFDTNELITVDANGIASGIVKGGTWPAGFYSITVTDPATGESVTMEFEVYVLGETDGGATADTAGSQQQQGTPSRPELAQTGADAFGPAGLALATLVAGAGAIVASRRLAK